MSACPICKCVVETVGGMSPPTVTAPFSQPSQLQERVSSIAQEGLLTSLTSALQTRKEAMAARFATYRPPDLPLTPSAPTVTTNENKTHGTTAAVSVARRGVSSFTFSEVLKAVDIFQKHKGSQSAATKATSHGLGKDVKRTTIVNWEKTLRGAPHSCFGNVLSQPYSTATALALKVTRIYSTVQVGVYLVHELIRPRLVC